MHAASEESIRDSKSSQQLGMFVLEQVGILLLVNFNLRPASASRRYILLAPYLHSGVARP